MQFLLTKIFIKRRLGGFHDEYAKQGKVIINPMKTLQPEGQGLSPGWMAAASWQVAYIQSITQTVENP